MIELSFIIDLLNKILLFYSKIDLFLDIIKTHKKID
jgi:hypothetical protein